MTCRNKINDLVDNKDKLNDIEKSLNDLMVLSFIYGLYLILVETWLAFLSHKEQHYGTIFFERFEFCESCYILNIFLGLVKFVLHITFGFIDAILLNNITYEDNLLQTFKDKDCVDE
jgi:hypothetical protein